MENTEKIIFLFLGWLLGLLSPIIADAIRKRREAVEVSIALQTELHELRYRLACSAYFIEIRFGEVNRQFLEWLQPVFRNYKGINPSENLLKLVEMSLTYTDQQIAALAEHSKTPPDGALSLKKYSSPLLDSKISSLSWFSERLRNQLLELKTHQALLNEEVEQARYFSGLTFQSSISDENYKRAVENVINGYKQYSSRARLIVDLIGKMQW